MSAGVVGNAPYCLIVDDEERLRQVLMHVMRSDGFRCVEAGSGEEALEQLRRHPFSLMLSDLKMPGMSGAELLRRVRDLQPDVAVVMVTGVPDVEAAVSCLANGAMDYLTKPIEMDDLAQAVNSAAQHRRYELKRVSGPQPVIPQVAPGANDVELVGGPLDSRRVRVEDARYRLWVVMQPDGEHVWASIDPPANLPNGTRTIGSYSFDPTSQ